MLFIDQFFKHKIKAFWAHFYVFFSGIDLEATNGDSINVEGTDVNTIDVDECADPGRNLCQSFETCSNSEGGHLCSFNYTANCPSEKYPVQWKGVSFLRQIFLSKKNEFFTPKFFYPKKRIFKPKFVYTKKRICMKNFVLRQ